MSHDFADFFIAQFDGVHGCGEHCGADCTARRGEPGTGGGEMMDGAKSGIG